MYQQKIPKSQLPDKTLITSYYPHTESITKRQWDQEAYCVISIDPGIRHFAIRIETRPMIDRNYFHPQTNILVKKDFKDFLTGETGENRLYFEVNLFLDQYREWFPKVHLVLVEKQMPINYKMVRLSQHVITYFHCVLKNLPLLPSILEVDPKLKTQLLGAPKGLNKPEVKKWAVMKALEILSIREDNTAIDIINRITKKDDLSDVVVQIEACFKYYQLPVTKIPVKIDMLEDTPNIPSGVTLLSGDDDDNVSLSVNIDSSDKISLQDIIANAAKPKQSTPRNLPLQNLPLQNLPLVQRSIKLI